METCQVYRIDDDGTVTDATLADTAPESGYLWISGSPEHPGIAGWCASHLPPLACQALLQHETRPRALEIAPGFVVILRGVNLNPQQKIDDMVSVRCWVGPGVVITLRHRPVFALKSLQNKALEGHAPVSPEDFLVRLAEELIARIETASMDLEDHVDELEDRVFDGDSSTTPNSAHLAQLRRSTIRMRRYVGPDAVALQDAGRLVRAGEPSGNPLRAALLETANRAVRSVEELDAARDRLTALADHIDIEQSVRQQRNGFLLSIVAAIFLPLGFLTGLFGVNIAGMPGIDWPPAFWVLSGSLILIAVIVAAVLRMLRWF